MRGSERWAIGPAMLGVIGATGCVLLAAGGASAQNFAGRIEELDSDGVESPAAQTPAIFVHTLDTQTHAYATPGVLNIRHIPSGTEFFIPVPNGEMATKMSFYDIDHDGDEDLTICVFEKVYHSINNAGTFQALTSAIADTGGNFLSSLNVAVADVNPGTHADLVVAVTHGIAPDPPVQQLHVYLGQPGATYAPPLVLDLLGTSPGAVCTAGLDADALDDIVVSINGGVVIARCEAGAVKLVDAATGASLPAGSPVSQATVPFPSRVREILLEDCNADGKKDLVCADLQNVRLRAGNGDGTFSSTLVTLPAESGYYSVTVGDVTGDKLPEIFAVNFNTDRVHAWVATAPFVYAPQVKYAAGHDPVSILIRDVNDDGFKDLKILHRADGAIMEVLGKGDGSFFFPQRLDNTNPNPEVAIGDFNGDGYNDAVGGGNSGFVFIHFNVGDGSGWLLPTESESGDRVTVQVKQLFMLPGPGAVAGDGRERFIMTYSDSFAWMEYDATRVLGRRAVARGFLNIGIEVVGAARCDFNGDGRPDIVTTFAGTNPCARVYAQDASGGYSIPPIDITTTSAGGFDRVYAPEEDSGLPVEWLFFHDLQTGRTEVQEYNGLLFAFKAEFQSGAPSTGAALGDIDGDGKADLIVANANSGSGVRRVTVQTHLDAASPPAASFFPLPRYPSNVAAADIDGDGDTDVVACTAGPAGENQLSLVIPNSGVTLDANAIEFYGAGGQPKRIVLADLNDPLTRGESEWSRPEIITADSDPPSFSFVGTLTVLPNISHLAAQPPACPGDANGDGTVGLGDVALMIQHWSLTEPPVPPFTLGDLTGDGLVTLADIAIVILNWSVTCP